jgi:PAS domain S-box-containing protein
MSIDTSKLQNVEDALAAERERLSMTLRLVDDGVVATDADGRIVLVSKVAETLTGWAEEEAIGKPLSEVFHIINEETREHCEDLVETILRTGGMFGFANCSVLIARDETERIITDSGGPIYDKDSNIIGVVLVFRDITERRKMEEELLRTQRLESIDVLAGGIAHDFNNILTAILGNISLAKMYADPGDEVFQRLTEAERASMQARDLTRQLLTFSRGGAPALRATCIAELLKNSASFVLMGSNVRCEFSIPDDLWPVEIDKGKISQVISNLIINADHAMPEGGIIKVRAENVVVEAVDSPPLGRRKYIRISIQDQGVGIPEEHLQKIFDPYFTTKQEGSGLGLAISHSIIKNHGGHIAVESQKGIGTAFFVYLPASSGKVLTSHQLEGKPIMGAGNVLMMDDEEIVRDLAYGILSNIGYKVTIAADGAEAIELYKKAKQFGRPFDAVIMDLTVPGGMGGREATRKLTEIDPEAKVIVSSGYSNDPIMFDFRKHGFSDVIAKPYKVKELSEVLHKVISDR